MTDINKAKLDRLMQIWIEHEHWIQGGCKVPKDDRLNYPGYGFLSGQDVRAYDYYRHSMVQFFNESLGFSGVHESLLEFISDAKARNDQQ